MERTTVEEQWHKYASMVFDHVPTDSVQYNVMREVFYAGAWVALIEAKKVAVINNRDSRYLNDLESEAESFHRGNIRRHAEDN